MIDCAEGDASANNVKIAAAFDEVAQLLATHGANPFRVRAYRVAADTVRSQAIPLRQLWDAQGRDGLMQLPGIGRSLAQSIEHLVRWGRLPLLERLRGEDTGEQILATVPNIGPGLARRIHDVLGIESLNELEAAARDGRLAQVAGMGNKRIRAVRESLAGRFAERNRIGAKPSYRMEPIQSVATEHPDRSVSVGELLEIDAQYRHLAELGKLPRITPRRFNPTQAAWLPVLHTERGNRHYSVLFSNTARAHELGTTHDWVVITRDDHGGSGRWTVITANYGSLRGRRIVRGREEECADLDHPPSAHSPADVAAGDELEGES